MNKRGNIINQNSGRYQTLLGGTDICPLTDIEKGSLWWGLILVTLEQYDKIVNKGMKFCSFY